MTTPRKCRFRAVAETHGMKAMEFSQRREAGWTQQRRRMLRMDLMLKRTTKTVVLEETVSLLSVCAILLRN